MGFWIMPLLLFMPQTVPYNVAWVIDTPWQIFPVIVWPFAGLGAAGLIFFTLKKTEPPETRRGAGFIIFLILLAPVLYLLGPRIGLVDVRFIPPAQALLLIAGAALAGRILHPLKLSAAAALALALITMAWTAHFENVTDQWMDWNYSGYESKRLWPTFQEINHYLQGDFSDPRVVYEHAEETGDVGSIRAFESLPLFSGRATLEGLYMQASLSAPFVFYLQSEVSKICSSPLANYNYSRFNLARADGHFQLFNVGHYITVTGEARTKAQSYPGLELLKTSEPFSIFRVKGNTGRYAVQPEYAPVLVLTKEPLAEAFAWFRFSDLKTPLVLAAEVNERDRKLFAEVLGSGLTWDKLANLPRMKLPHAPELEEIITDNEIIIRGAVPGRPLWIKTSYHPGWKVEGADKIWRASPAFMLVFPDKSEVRLYFARTWPEYVGLALTITALLFAAVTFTNRPKARPGIVGRLDSLLSPVTRIIKPRAGLILGIVLAVVFGALFLFILLTHHQDPIIFFNRGLKHYQAGQYQQARIFFSRAAERFPLSPVIDQTLHHLALSFFREESYDQAIKVWNRLPEEYPESRLLMEALYHIGLCRLGLGQFEPARIKFYEVIQLDPDSPWAVEAGLRLAEIKGSGG